MPSTGDSVNKELEQSKSSADRAIDLGKDAYDFGKKLHDRKSDDSKDADSDNSSEADKSPEKDNSPSTESKNEPEKPQGIDENRLSPNKSKPKDEPSNAKGGDKAGEGLAKQAEESGAGKGVNTAGSATSDTVGAAGKAGAETAGTAAGEATGTAAGEAVGSAAGTAAGEAAGTAAGAGAGAGAGAAAGAGAGTVLAPGVGTVVGMVGGLVIGKHWKKILIGIVIVAVLIIFAPILLMSAIPIAFNNATMIRREYSSEEVKQVTENNVNHSADDEQQMIQAFEIIQKLVSKEESTFSKVEEKRENSKYKDTRGKKYDDQKERNAIINATKDENWDIAYLAAAYQISRRMYEDPPDASFGLFAGSGATQYSQNKKFMMPCAGYISSYMRPGGGGNHENGCAVDIANNHGTPEYAPISGTVIQASDKNDGYGIYVIINASDPTLQGWSTLCAHMSEAKVVVGQQVKQGQVIGLMGSTGDSTGDHCHFEILKNGEAQLLNAAGLFPGLAEGQEIKEIKKTDENSKSETSEITKTPLSEDSKSKSKQQENADKNKDKEDEYTKKVDRYISEMVNMCNDDSFGYQFAGRGPKDFDCSSSIIQSLKRAGFNVPANACSSDTIIYVSLTDNGWNYVNNFGNEKGGNQDAGPLKPGDILINKANHASMYIGNNQVAEFSSDYDGVSGDSNKQEAWIHSYYSFPWDYALRYHNGGTGAAVGGASGGSYEVDMVFKLANFVTNILKPTEIKTHETVVHEAEYPTYQKVKLTLKRTDGIVETKEVYEFIEMKKTSIPRKEKQYNEIPALGDLVGGSQVLKRTVIEGTDKNTTQSHKYFTMDAEKEVEYNPTTEEKEVVKQVVFPWKKAKALQAFDLKPEDDYRGDKFDGAEKTKLSNAEYAEYLRKSLIELINIKEDYASGEPLFRWPLNQSTKQAYNIWSKYDAASGDYKTDTERSSVEVSIIKGTPVYAMAEGEVKISEKNWGSYGKYVQIKHKNGYSTGYGYLSQIMVSKDKKVKRGQIIGYTGDNRKNGNHNERLIFHIIKGDEKGKPVDPLSFFEAKDNNNFECDSPQYAAEFNHKELKPKAGGSRQARAPEEFRDEIIQGMVELGMTPREELVQKVIRQIDSESGGNPQAVQGISDINSGNPITTGDGKCHWCPNDAGRHCGDTNIAHGLLQTIITTFEGNKAPGHDDIFNSYDNILAALKYMRNNYGENFDGIGEGHGY